MHVEEQQLVQRQLVDGCDLDRPQDASEGRYLAAPLRRSQEIEDRGEGRIHRARQRLPGHLGTRGQVHDRLIDGLERALADRALQRHQLVGFVPHLRRIQPPARR